jgi:hypothetical protein
MVVDEVEDGIFCDTWQSTLSGDEVVESIVGGSQERSASRSEVPKQSRVLSDDGVQSGKV